MKVTKEMVGAPLGRQVQRVDSLPFKGVGLLASTCPMKHLYKTLSSIYVTLIALEVRTLTFVLPNGDYHLPWDFPLLPQNQNESVPLNVGT